jgi:hypothetical protein
MRVRQVGSPGWSFFILMVPTFAGIALALLLSSLYAAPITTLVLCFSFAAGGAVLIVVAKWAVIRQGHLFSFGPARMSNEMKVLWRIGWLLLIVGTMTTLLLVGLFLRHR